MMGWCSLLHSKDNMNTRISVHDSTQFIHLKSERCVFEWFLHLSSFEQTQIAPSLGRWTVTVDRSQFAKLPHEFITTQRTKLTMKSLKCLNCFFLRSRYLFSFP